MDRLVEAVAVMFATSFAVGSPAAADHGVFKTSCNMRFTSVKAFNFFGELST